MDAVLGPLGAETGVMLALCLVIALGFEFVHGFHDTANAVATVIYTNTLRPWVAVVYSRGLKFLGVMVGDIAVAMAILHLIGAAAVEIAMSLEGSEASTRTGTAPRCLAAAEVAAVDAQLEGHTTRRNIPASERCALRNRCSDWTRPSRRWPGVRRDTVRNVAQAWLLTLPVAMTLGALFFLILAQVLA